MRQWEYQPEARAELEASMAWYERERAGLGVQLLDIVETALTGVTSEPMPGTRLAPSRPEYFRRVRVELFPYTLILDARADRRIVLAIAHLRRRPNYWRRRLTK